MEPESDIAQQHGRPIRKLVKFLVWTVLLGFVFVLFASILAVVGAWMLFSPTISADAVTVREMTEGITQIELPEGLEPRFSASEKLLGTKLAVYTDVEQGEENRFLLLTAFPHGKQHLPKSLQNWLEEEMAVVRPARKGVVLGDGSEPAERPSAFYEFALPEISVDVRDKVRMTIDRELTGSEIAARPLGPLDLPEGFASEDDTEHEYVIRGKPQTVTIRKGKDRGIRVVRVFAPFEAEGDKPALLVFGTPEERWEERDSKDFEAMLESMR